MYNGEMFVPDNQTNYDLEQAIGYWADRRRDSEQEKFYMECCRVLLERRGKPISKTLKMALLDVAIYGMAMDKLESDPELLEGLEQETEKLLQILKGMRK